MQVGYDCRVDQTQQLSSAFFIYLFIYLFIFFLSFALLPTTSLY